MLSSEEHKRYSRHIILSEIGKEGQEKLKNAKVLVIGAGGLGCPILQYLTAAGVGTIGIVDFDKVDESNLQRQVLFDIDSVGRNKAIVAKEKLSKLNPLIKFITYTEAITEKNALSMIAEFDIVVDGSDNFSTRYLVNDACIILQKTLVFGAIYKFDGQLSVFNYKGGPSYRCLFPTPPPPNSVPNCSDVGVLGVLPGIIGSLQANETLKVILELGNILTGKVFTFDALTMQSFTFEFEKDEKNKNITTLLDNYDVFCGVAPVQEENEQEYLIEDLSDLSMVGEEYLLVDVRPMSEHEEFNLGGENLPLETLPVRHRELPKDKLIILYCAYGQRSAAGVKLLKQKDFTKVTHIQQGISYLQEDTD